MSHFVKILLVLGLLNTGWLNPDLGAQGWQDHFSYRQSFALAETPGAIYAATRLGLVVYSKADQALTTLNKINGLSDYGISSLAYSKEQNTLVIAYENGNIDLLTQERIYNINDLKIKQLSGSKAINHILPEGTRAYLSTDFGILVVNLQRREIESTYYIGDQAADLKVNQMAADADYLYAATGQGIKRASKTAPDLPIYSTWETISANTNNYSSLEVRTGLVVASEGEKGASNTLWLLNDMQTINLGSLSAFSEWTMADDRFLAVSGTALYYYNDQGQRTGQLGLPANHPLRPAFRSAYGDTAGNIWVADFNNGLLVYNNEAWVQLLPDGPFSNQAHSLQFSGDKLWVVPGGLTSAWNNANIAPSISVLMPDGWKVLNTQNNPLLLNSRDLLSITPHPQNPDQLYISSWGSGLFQVEADGTEAAVGRHFLTPENGLVNIFENNSRYVRVATSAFDNQGTLWMTNSSVASSLVAYFPEEDRWQRYSYGALSDNQGMAPILATSNGDMWLSVYRGDAKGLFIWNDNGTPQSQSDDYYRSAIPQSADSDRRNMGQILLWDEDGQELTNNILALEEDANGHIWLGTDKGVVVQYQPGRIFSIERPVFSRILIPRGDGWGDYLLDGQAVSSILTDPGNRKWLGTQGYGLYLVSANGMRQLAHFNTENSPLPSNYINDLSLNEATGELYIATGEGLVVYKGNATRAEASFDQLYAYPNPVRPGFTGNITISGLMEKTTVKITDVAGKLVFETNSVGAQAFWDGRNLWGREVKSGVYLIFVATEDGSQSAVTKIAIVR